jgi:transcriptional regulator with XRE-family HTH domain
LPFYRWSLAAPTPIPGLPESLDHIGHHILKRRLDLGLRQLEAARQLGVHPSGLENWEYGRTHPADRFMPAVIRFLGYNPSPAPTTGAQRVAYERVVHGWSRKRLAIAASVDEATVRRIENNAPRLSRRALGAVMAVLGIQR